MAHFYHWWVSLFVVPDSKGGVDLAHAADTAGYWAQAIGSVLAVFAAIFLARWQYSQKRGDERKERELLCNAVDTVVSELDEVLLSLCRSGLKRAVLDRDKNFVPQAKRILEEFSKSLGQISLTDLAKSGMVVPAHRVRKAVRDAMEILSFVDVNSALDLLNDPIKQLEKVREAIAEARTLIPVPVPRWWVRIWRWLKSRYSCQPRTP